MLYTTNKITCLYIESSRGGKFTTDPVLLFLQNVVATRCDKTVGDLWDARCIELFGEVAEVVFSEREKTPEVA